MRERGDDHGAGQAETKLTEIQDALDGISRRAANIRAGHVYVISNVGAFGEDIVKIGMTSRATGTTSAAATPESHPVSSLAAEQKPSHLAVGAEATSGAVTATATVTFMWSRPRRSSFSICAPTTSRRRRSPDLRIAAPYSLSPVAPSLTFTTVA